MVERCSLKGRPECGNPQTETHQPLDNRRLSYATRPDNHIKPGSKFQVEAVKEALLYDQTLYED